MEMKEIYARLSAKVPGTEVVDAPGDPFATIPPAAVVEACRFLRDDPDLRFDYCACVTGVDDTKDFWVVYHLYSIPKNHRAVLKVRLDRKEPVVASVVGVWKGADWHERETYDLYGIKFEGHPDLRRILLPEDWPGYPLRKDYEFPDEYQGIPLK